MLAFPGGIFKVALNFGCDPRWVPPKRRKASLGLKPKEAQLPTWKGLAVLKTAPAVLANTPLTLIALQLVGLIVVSGRSMRSRTSRTRKSTPCRIVGSGSDTAFTWAFSELT